jgi:hypothetical protein
LKLAMDRVYMRHATVFYDVRILLRTIAVVLARSFGKQRFADPPELAKATLMTRLPARR